MEFNRFYRIIRDKYITYAAAVEDFELLKELDSISHEQANYLFRTLLITENFKKAIIKRIKDKETTIWFFNTNIQKWMNNQ